MTGVQLMRGIAALMRPDRFTAVFGLSVPYGSAWRLFSTFEHMRKSGHESDFYMFEQIRPKTPITFGLTPQSPSQGFCIGHRVLHQPASGGALMDPTRSLHRPAPGPLPHGRNQIIVAHNVSEFQRTGFHGGLKLLPRRRTVFLLVRRLEKREDQPTFVLHGGEGGWLAGALSTRGKLRAALPGLVGISKSTMWVNLAFNTKPLPEVSDQLVKFPTHRQRRLTRDRTTLRPVGVQPRPVWSWAAQSGTTPLEPIDDRGLNE